MPITRGELERKLAEAAPGTPLEQVLEVEEVYWSSSLTDAIYFVDSVLGKRIAIVPAPIKGRHQTGA